YFRWREGFWPVVTNVYGWEIAETGSVRQYRFEILEDPCAKLFTGEYGRLGSFEKQRPPFDQKNPFIATVGVNRELHGEKSERSCRHIEFVTNAARIRYETGDHLGVFPTNDPNLVDELAKLIGVNMDLSFSLINLDEESLKKNPFPCPCTVRTALTHYVDICAPVKSHVLRALASFTSDETERERLLLLSTANQQGLKERRSIVDILRAFSTCKPPIDCLLELLPRLQVLLFTARYYSISSSPKTNSDSVAITVVITKYMIGDRLIKGNEGSKVPIFVRRSTMRLPHRLTTPVIMVGPGTGFAPFRGFLQERACQKKQGKTIGPMALYFGCRHPEHDYIYEDELKSFLQDGVLSELHEKTSLAHTITDCSDARNMARDVQNTFIRIYTEIGRKTESDAQAFQKDMERQRRYQADVWS
ncbi:unnamed protein product, partial [Gongylonema pulchrum]|uniref:NADPH--hemoprotein reductase n=1 Tax=Gongylonema pulchrum TaxID=637853 RepID=A0A183DT06_9BILA